MVKQVPMAVRGPGACQRRSACAVREVKRQRRSACAGREVKRQCWSALGAKSGVLRISTPRAFSLRDCFAAVWVTSTAFPVSAVSAGWHSFNGGAVC
jgi:hypothetical protein